MKLEQQVTSLELSKKLKELGVKQESLWWWVKWNKKVHTKGNFPISWQVELAPHKKCKSISAFTVAELLELCTKTGTKGLRIGVSWDRSWRADTGGETDYIHTSSCLMKPSKRGIKILGCETPQEALGKLLENKLI